MFNTIFDEFYGLTKRINESLQTYHTDESTVCIMDLPGYNKENLKVELKEGVLSIEGKRSIKVDGIKDPIRNHSISRSYTIGNKFDEEKIKAEMNDGILMITLPLKSESKKTVISLL
jgi:HSP20 family molecular chaperone IbpA